MTDILKNGKNTLGIVLGNGLRNAWGGFIWDFDKAVFRGAPITAFSLELLYSDGAKETIISDSQTKTAPSPILYDDLHTGEMFDARLQIPDWASPDYEDGNWSFALKAEAPRGELKICEAELAYNMIVRPDFVKASYTAKDGTVAVDWKRNGDTVVINIELTGKVYGKIILPNGFAFEDNSREKELKTAEYTVFKLEK